MRKNLESTFQPRQYMLSKDFEIYYYNSKTLSGVLMHSHDYYEFYFFLKGNASVTIGGDTHTLKINDMLLIPPHTSHQVTLENETEAYERVVFWMSQDYCNQLMLQSKEYGYLMQRVITSKDYIFHYDALSFNAIRSKLFSLIEEIQSDRFGREAKIGLCVSDLVFHLNRTVYEMDHPKTPKEEHSIFQNLLTYIEDHLEEDLSLNQLATEFYLSKYHIAHIFKDNLGLSVHQYILKKRLAKCRDAILGSMEPGKAYLLCGFTDYSSFYRAFKKEYGVSPSEYKELYTHHLTNPD